MVSCIAAIAGSPFDVIKTRTQAGLIDDSIGLALQRIVREEGYMALFRGIRPRITRLGVGTGEFHSIAA